MQITIVHTHKATMFPTRAEAEAALEFAPAGRDYKFHDWRGATWIEVSRKRGGRSAVHVLSL